MLTLKRRNFYYGALLADMLGDGVRAVLIKSNDSRGLFQCTTDAGEFALHMKYASNKTSSRTDCMSWNFSLSPNEIRELSSVLADDSRDLKMALICGDEENSKGTYAVLNKQDIRIIREKNVSRLTISIRPRENYFRVNVGGGRGRALRIPARRRIGFGNSHIA